MSTKMGIKELRDLAIMLNIKLSYRGKRRTKLSLYTAIKRAEKRDGKNYLKTLRENNKIKYAIAEADYRSFGGAEWKKELDEDMNTRANTVLPNTRQNKKTWALNVEGVDLEDFDDGSRKRPKRAKRGSKKKIGPKRKPTKYNLFVKAQFKKNPRTNMKAIGALWRKKR